MHVKDSVLRALPSRVCFLALAAKPVMLVLPANQGVYWLETNRHLSRSIRDRQYIV